MSICLCVWTRAHFSWVADAELTLPCRPLLVPGACGLPFLSWACAVACLLGVRWGSRPAEPGPPSASPVGLRAALCLCTLDLEGHWTCHAVSALSELFLLIS